MAFLAKILTFTDFFLNDKPNTPNETCSRNRYHMSALREKIGDVETKVSTVKKSVNAKNGYFGPKRVFFDLLAFFMDWDLIVAKIGRRYFISGTNLYKISSADF